MSSKAAITIQRPRDEVQRLWESAEHPEDASLRFEDAPADRGTEIYVDLGGRGADGLRGALRKPGGSPDLAKVKDELRRFKQRVETGEVARSDATPEGEKAEAKLKQRPAQPLSERELETVGAR